MGDKHVISIAKKLQFKDYQDVLNNPLDIADGFNKFFLLELVLSSLRKSSPHQGLLSLT